MIDHLVYGVPDLAHGIDMLERSTGVRALFGGQHPGRGTHNALMSLGERRYLEIIALDPAQPHASDLLFPQLRGLTRPSFVAWAIGVASIEEAAAQARALGLSVLGPLEGQRARADGSLLRWKTLRLVAPSLALVPFFIAWDKATAHPSLSSPAGCTLLSCDLHAPDPGHVRGVLGGLMGEVGLFAGPKSQLVARLATPKGEIELGR